MKQENAPGSVPEQLLKNRQALGQLAQSGQARQLVQLLEQSGGVQQAAQAAAAGRPEQLIGMMERLMATQEGSRLLDGLSQQIKQAGLD